MANIYFLKIITDHCINKIILDICVFLILGRQLYTCRSNPKYWFLAKQICKPRNKKVWPYCRDASSCIACSLMYRYNLCNTCLYFCVFRPSLYHFCSRPENISRGKILYRGTSTCKFGWTCIAVGDDLNFIYRCTLRMSLCESRVLLLDGDASSV